MAITKILHLKEAGKAVPSKHLKQAITYITNANKTQSGKLIGALNCQPDFAYQQMLDTKKNFNKLNNRQGYHIIISFQEGEVSPEIAFKIVEAFSQEYLSKDYEAIYAIHDDTEHIHGHIIFNSVSYRTGLKYRYERGDWKKEIQPIVNRLCEQYSLSTIHLEGNDFEKETGNQPWNEYQENYKVWNQMIRRDLDICILKAKDFTEFRKMLNDRGYETKQGKYLALKPPGMKRFRRCKSLGIDYTEEQLKERIKTESLEKMSKFKEQPRIGRTYVKRYRRLPLSKLQKKYYAKLYRTGMLKKRPYSQVWKYKKDIQTFEKLKQELDFLNQYRIRDRTELHEKIQSCQVIKKNLEQEKRALFRQRSNFKEYFEKHKRAEYLLEAARCFQNGDTYFQKEYNEYKKIIADLQSYRLDLKSVIELQDYYDSRLSELRQKEKAVQLELETARRIYLEVTKKEIEKQAIQEVQEPRQIKSR